MTSYGPAFDQSVFDRPVFDRPVFDQPVFDQSVFDQSVFDQSVFDQFTRVWPAFVVPKGAFSAPGVWPVVGRADHCLTVI